jgi:hypothetical protein
MIAWPCRHEAGINGRRNTSHPDPAVLRPPDTTPQSPLTALNGGSANVLPRRASLSVTLKIEVARVHLRTGPSAGSLPARRLVMDRYVVSDLAPVCSRCVRPHPSDNAAIVDHGGACASRSRFWIPSASSWPAATDMVRSNASSSVKSRV